MASPPRRSSLVTGLRRLAPNDFENLSYDILFLSGVRNLQWRTPSADGGRDLEGDLAVVDFSGEPVRQRWYIECKRYSRSLNWSTVHEKLAVASNHGADYLLFITTANFSPQCRDEVQLHNAKRGLQIRIWPFYYLERLLTVHGQVAVKYGLIKINQALHVDFEQIILELMKLSQSTYAALEFGKTPYDRVALIAALTELISTRIDDTKKHGRFTVRRFKPDRDSYDWCKPTPLQATDFDASSLRAALASAKTILNVPQLECKTSGGEVRILVPSTAALRTNQLFGLVSTFGLIDWELEPQEIILKAR
jgi:Restriction endonuclease